ncbi:hypothetical protein ACVW0Q_002382 [Thermostichus sp. MS-CIW-21]|uniref:hypothetical protein n=1 Tax=unclassified Synechococcus TaxID=2626047 RepID=UPI001F0B544E|nr:hypothetical protein [Synechococcus sp. 65AY6A5]
MVRERNARLAGSGVVAPGEEPQPVRAGGTESLTGEPSSPPEMAVLLRNLLSELSVAWLLLLGLFLVVVSSGVLAASLWEEFSPTAQYGVLLAYTAAFGVGAGRQEGLRLTGQTLEAIALLLLPINMWALDGLGIPWGIRVVALGLLIGIPLAVWRRARLLGVGSAFYETLAHFLALSSLHLFWSLGPSEFRPTVVLGILYLGVVGAVAYTWSRRLLQWRGARLWPIGAAGSLLIWRGLLSGQVQVSQLGLGGSLLLLSFPHPAIRFWHLLLSTGILAWWLQQKSGVGNGWVFLTHAYWLGALLAGILWLGPDSSLSAWGGILLLLGLLQWAGRVALGGRLSAPAGQRLRLWQQSAVRGSGTESFGMGLVLLGSSYLVFLAQGAESIGWLWLAVPLVLNPRATVGRVLAGGAGLGFGSTGSGAAGAGLPVGGHPRLWPGRLAAGMAVDNDLPAAAVGHGHPAGPASDLDGSQF